MKQNAVNSLELWVAGKLQCIREMIPGPAMSDDATKLQINRLVALANEVGMDRFQSAVETAIDTQERRPTVATMRKLCGVSSIDPSSVTEAWELITRVVTRHIQRDGNGMALLAPKMKMVDGYAVSEPVPTIPPDVFRAVVSLGGWGSLSDSYPAWWSQKYQQFREIFYQAK